ncbi:MAG TPA: hypothetical protein VIB48_17915, partial [Acidimicrobiia bacterium]
LVWRVLHAANSGGLVTPRQRTVAEYLLEDWLPAISTSVARSTWASYERNVRVHVASRIGDVQLQTLSPLTLNKLYSELLVSGRGDDKPGGLSSRTVNYIASISIAPWRTP